MSRVIPVVVLIACAVSAARTPAAPVPAPAPTDEQERLLARGKKFLKEGKIDLFVAVTAVWKLKVDDLRQWEPAADLGRRLIDQAVIKRDNRPQDSPSSYKDFATYLHLWQPQFKRLDETYHRPNPDKAVPPVAFYYEAIQAPSVVDPASISSCLILSRGSVQADLGIGSSLVFANGDVKARTVMSSVVIVCDGDVTVVERHIAQSVIVARGNITAKQAGTVTLMAGGKITLENKGALKTKGISTLVEGKPNTLGVVFFELSTVGLAAKVADTFVTVAKVAPGSACEKAGVKAGDVIVSVNGKEPTDAESLRRLLRDALAVGDAAVKVRRGDQVLTLKVALPE